MTRMHALALAGVLAAAGLAAAAQTPRQQPRSTLPKVTIYKSPT
jgi:hypothetical protein